MQSSKKAIMRYKTIEPGPLIGNVLMVTDHFTQYVLAISLLGTSPVTQLAGAISTGN